MHHSLWMETIGSVACDALEWTSLHLSPSTPTLTPTPSTARPFPGYHPHQERMGISKQELITMLEEEGAAWPKRWVRVRARVRGSMAKVLG